jgi:hypothetical protein
MAAETDSACFIDGGGNRFGDVMKQNSENERTKRFPKKSASSACA